MWYYSQYKACVNLAIMEYGERCKFYNLNCDLYNSIHI